MVTHFNSTCRGKGPAVDWHLSGHSHRSGVYKVQWQQAYTRTGRRIQVVSARDPGIHGPQTVKPDTHTALIVTSSGGPIGYQNLDGELSAWTGRPPAGTLLDTATGQIRQVSTSKIWPDNYGLVGAAPKGNWRQQLYPLTWSGRWTDEHGVVHRENR
jgi:hypothetical protein